MYLDVGSVSFIAKFFVNAFRSSSPDQVKRSSCGLWYFCRFEEQDLAFLYEAPTQTLENPPILIAF